MEYLQAKRKITANFFNCNIDQLTDYDNLNIFLRETAKELNIGKVENTFYTYNPLGITKIIQWDNSYLIFMTNIEKKSSSINLFTTLPEINTYPAFSYACKILGGEKFEILESISLDNSYSALCNVRHNNTSPQPAFENRVITILGSSGGVANALLSILNNAAIDTSDPIYSFIKDCTINLIDIKQHTLEHYNNKYFNLKNKMSVFKFDGNNTQLLKNFLRLSKTDILIDISYADTVSTLSCCNELGVIYINSAFESTSVDENEDYEGFPLQERFKIFESRRDEFKNTTAIICSGMNPGIVQWMAIEVMKKYPQKTPKGCYIVEDDSSFFEDVSLAKADTIYTTWSPVCFLDEAIYSYPNFIKNHLSLFFYDEIYSLEFKVTLGDKVFYGSLMPHEEALTLGKMYNMETGFIYKVNEHTTKIIRDNIENVDILWEKPMEVLLPDKAPLKGTDQVGVLLVYDDMEAYMFNSLDNKNTYKKYKTNATYLQVASGLYGGLSTILLDEIPLGIYYVDELLTRTLSSYGKYVTYHLKEFTIGENLKSDGDLINRVRKIIP